MYRIFILTYLFFLPLKAFSTEVSPAQQVEVITDKLYVKPAQIYFANDRIFVINENKLIEADYLSIDEQGMYCGVKVEGYPKDWKCPKCKSRNENRDYCEVCAYWPSGAK